CVEDRPQLREPARRRAARAHRRADHDHSRAGARPQDDRRGRRDEGAAARAEGARLHVGAGLSSVSAAAGERARAVARGDRRPPAGRFARRARERAVRVRSPRQGGHVRRPRVAGAARRSATTPAGPPGSIGRWRAVVCGAALVALLSAAAPGSAQNASRVATEESVKAAYLYKFAAYVDWPPAVFEGPDSAFTIAVMEDERLAAELAAVTEGRSVRGRPIRTRRLAADDPLADVHVLFLPPRDRGRANAEPPSADLPILTV